MSEQKIRLAYARKYKKAIDYVTLLHMSDEEKEEYINLYYEQEAKFKAQRRKSAILTTIYLALIIGAFIAFYGGFIFFVGKDSRYIYSKVTTPDACELAKNGELALFMGNAEANYKNEETDSKHSSRCSIPMKINGSMYFASISIDTSTSYQADSFREAEENTEGGTSNPIYTCFIEKNYYDASVTVGHVPDSFDTNNTQRNEMAKAQANLIGSLVEKNLPYNKDYKKDLQ